MTMNVVSSGFNEECEHAIRGLAGVLVRAGAAIERWGRRLAAEPGREQLAELRRTELEAIAGVQTRGDALTRGYGPLRG